MSDTTACPAVIIQMLELQNFFLMMEKPRKKSNAHTDALKRVREFGRAIKTVEGSSKYRSYLPGPEIIDFCKKLQTDVEKILK